MEGIQVFGWVLGSSLLTAGVGLLSDRLKRRDHVKDRSDDSSERIDALKKSTDERFQKVDEQIRIVVSTVDSKLNSVIENADANTRANRAQLFNTINHLGNKYIGDGANGIRNSDLRGLIELWTSYQDLIGDVDELTDGPQASYEHLKRVMSEVYKIRIISD